jgi:hypothetical protein
MLRRRDFADWNYPVKPEEILPIQGALRNDTWLDGAPVYYGSHSLPGQSFQRPWYSTILPGTGNTVKIHDKDYIFLYFMWAPADHKLVNYNKKFTDAQILQDIREKEPIEIPPAAWFVPPAGQQLSRKAYRILKQEFYRRNFVPPLGLTEKRITLLKMRQGLIRSRSVSLKTVAKLAAMSKVERLQALQNRESLLNIFHNRDGGWRQFDNRLFQPRTFKDLAIEYDAFGTPRNGPSLAYVAALQAQENGTDPRDEYETLLEDYRMYDQIDRLMRHLDEYTLREIRYMLGNVRSWLRMHERPTEPHFDQSESYWPPQLFQKFLQVERALVARNQEILQARRVGPQLRQQDQAGELEDQEVEDQEVGEGEDQEVEDPDEVEEVELDDEIDEMNL